MLDDEITAPHSDQQTGMDRGVLLHWFTEGARTAVLMPPRWQYLPTTPMMIAVIVVLDILLNLSLHRLSIVGPATFYWRAITGVWFETALLAWLCYLVRAQSPAESNSRAAPSATHLFTMTLAQTFIINLGIGLLFAMLIRKDLYTVKFLGTSGMWAIWLALTLWGLVAQVILLWRGSDGKQWPIFGSALVLIAFSILNYAAHPAEFWYPKKPTEADSAVKPLKLTQELMESQPQLLTQRLNEIRPQRPGVIDLYAITFAPYAEESVFRKESEIVTQVMARRFDADGRTLQLVNHAQTATQFPWATPLNLHRAIQRFATIMDRDEDVFFIHLTSHGARNGELSADLWPMDVAMLKPADLKTWLDQAGIKHRVISISACYSGSWIATLANDDTLVMTASDAEHTSYGCGNKSDLTFFGRAMYDEQLRSATISFEEAHAAARKIIKQREETAGKDDGYSNPQIKVGATIRVTLARLQARLQAQNAHR